MTFLEYSEQARTFESFPKDVTVAYLLLGLGGEAGELQNKYKKILRDARVELTEEAVLPEEAVLAMRQEIGDVLWYLDRLAAALGSTLEQEAKYNIAKLTDRQRRGVIGGSGDNR